MTINEQYLKTFVLYCQSVEEIWMRYKSYWIKVLTEQKEDETFVWPKTVDMYKDFFKP